MGYDASTFPTMPSGVTTAMPRINTVVGALVNKTTLEFAPVPVLMIRAARSSRRAFALLKRLQGSRAIGGLKLGFEKLVLHLQA